MSDCFGRSNAENAFLGPGRWLVVLLIASCFLNLVDASKVEVLTVPELVQALNDETVDHIVLAARRYNFTEEEMPNMAAVISNRTVLMEGKDFGDGSMAYIDSNQLADRVYIIEGGYLLERNIWVDDCSSPTYPYGCFAHDFGGGSRVEMRDMVLSDATCVKWKDSYVFTVIISSARTASGVPIKMKPRRGNQREVHVDDTGWVPPLADGSHWRYVNVTLSCTGGVTHGLPENAVIVDRPWSRKETSALATVMVLLLSVLYWAYSRGYFSAPHEFHIARKRGYDLQAELGQGRFGKVYRAVHRSSGRKVAIKVVNLRPSKWRELRVAWRECQIMSGVRHPSCIRVITYYSHKILPMDVPFRKEAKIPGIPTRDEVNLDSGMGTPGSAVSSGSSGTSIARMYLDITSALDTIAAEEQTEIGAQLTAAMLQLSNDGGGDRAGGVSGANSIHSRSPAVDSLAATPDSTLDSLTSSAAAGRDALGGIPLGTMHLQVHLVMDFADQGTLLDAVRVGRFKLPSTALPNLPAIAASMLDVARGLAALHHPSRRLVHRDLSPTNVLLVSEFNDRGFRAVLTDFGLTTVVGLGQTHRTSDTRGTLAFMPPELLDDNVVSAGTDMYSLGVLIVFILMDGDPYKGFSPGRMISYKSGAADEQLVIPAELVDNQDPLMQGILRLARWCTRFERKMRPTAEEAVELLESLLQNSS